MLITSNLYKAQLIYEILSSLLDEEIFLFPSDELIRAETLASSKELLASRLYVLNSLVNKKANIVIANIASASRFLPSVETFKNHTINLKVGDKKNINELKTLLVESGYSQVNKIDQSLQFACRGDIIDIFSVNADNPIRIEFFDDEIESIRYFDIATQSSVKKINQVIVLPANDFILTKKELEQASDRINEKVFKAKEVLDQSTFEKLRDLSQMDIDNILDHNNSTRLYRYYSLLQDEHYCLLDYAKDFVKVFIDPSSLKNASTLLEEESWSYLQELFEKGQMISSLSLYHSYSTLSSIRKNVIETSSFIENNSDPIFKAKMVPFKANKNTDAVNIIRNYLNQNYRVVVCLSNNEQANLLSELLNVEHIKTELVKEFDIPVSSKVGISFLHLNNGFTIDDEKIVFLTNKELFNEKNHSIRFNSRFKEATIIKNYEDLVPGDYVVHEYHGIGQFVGIETLTDRGEQQDYLKIVYSGDETLYVSLSNCQLIRKFQGKEGAKPRLSHLHTKDWENTKAKIKARINDLADRLFKLYTERNKIEGFAFQKDDEFQKEFENSFEYELTKDQEKSLKEIKSDMEKPYPMDRLLCGDVGFGKTEVAFRAVFKAILSGKQAALLCPTTLLARQHFETAIERFKGFDVRIAVFSRLISEKKQKEYIKGIKDGSIHFVIGTHRLLSKDICFNDLGLLVVDEEQRFGVEQKEKIKEMKSNIDVLTLSATPIPRTLQISLLGVRSLSQINSAPIARMPIQTYVVPFDINVVKELIERELGRHGQAFYLHNDVSSIFEMAARLNKLIPNARIGAAHGQMDKDDIEDVMMKYYAGDIDVLVCTTIVENGIDIPNANLIIVEDSTRYGLSQLYQIKGRVGRGDRIAYAYLMYNGNKVINENAKKRLQALQDFTELGSGYRIAQRDLLIRGAGDVLGPEQAGFIDSIGLDMYLKLLNESVEEKLHGKPVIKNENKECVSLSINAFVPKDFADDSNKIEIYQEIMAASSFDSLFKIKHKMIDMYGELPQSVNLLFTKKTIDLLKYDADIKSLIEYPKTVQIILGDKYINIKGIGNILFEAFIPYLGILKLSYVNHAFKILMSKRDKWVDDLENILKTLTNILNNNKGNIEV